MKQAVTPDQTTIKKRCIAELEKPQPSSASSLDRFKFSGGIKQSSMEKIGKSGVSLKVTTYERSSQNFEQATARVENVNTLVPPQKKPTEMGISSGVANKVKVVNTQDVI